MMQRLGFNSELKAHECVAWLSSTYQVHGYVISAGSKDKAKVFVEVPEQWAAKVELNFEEFIV